jgi:hypothetical protein
LFKVQKKALHVRDTMEIERDGDTVARVKKALVQVVRDRFSVEVDEGEDLEAKGILLTTSTRSSAPVTMSLRSPGAGSVSGTPMASVLLPARTTR